MEIVNYSNARKNLSAILDSVEDNASYTIITRGKKPESVVMSLNFFKSMMETMHLLSSPANAARLMHSIAEVQQGKFEPKTLIHPDNE